MNSKRAKGPAPPGASVDFGRVLACLLLFVFVVVGAAAVLAPFVLEIPGLRARVEKLALSAVKDETGLTVGFHIERPLWPPGLVVRDVDVGSKTPGKSFAHIREARVTLRPFSLLSGDVVVDGVEVDGLTVDAEMREGVTIPTNLPLVLKPHAPKADAAPAADPPFRSLALTGAHVKVTYMTLAAPDRPASVDLAGIDLDVDAALEGGTTTLNARWQKAAGTVRLSRTQINGPPIDRFLHLTPKITPHPVWDEDRICGLSFNIQVSDGPASTGLDLRKFELDARLDGDETMGTAPTCEENAVDDEQVLHLHLDRFAIDLPKLPQTAASPAGKPAAPHLRIGPAAKLHLAAPALLALRWVQLPTLTGTLTLDLDLAADIDVGDPLPGVLHAAASGRIEGHELRFAQYRFGQSIAGDVTLKPPLVLSSNEIDVAYASGHVALKDLKIEAAPRPFDKKRMPVKVSLAVDRVTFPGLMRELGVSRASHVRWNIDQATTKLSGFLDPLQIDGELTAHTKSFEGAQREVEGNNPGHLVGIKAPVDLTTHVAIRADRLGFERTHLTFGRSVLDADAYIGFADSLDVHATSETLDLTEVSPLVSFPLEGLAKLDWTMSGAMGNPEGKGTLSVAGFSFDGFALGDMETATVHSLGVMIDVEAMRSRKGESVYEVPSLRVDLGKGVGAPIYVDALAKSANMSLDDFYGVFHMEGDPRWQGYQGHLGFDARAHFVVGGPDDLCKSGRLQLDARAKLLAMDLFGERFDGGSADLSLDWLDLGGGGLGFDLDLRAATLHKKGGGDIVASGRIARGGRLGLHVSAGGVSLKGLAAVPVTTIVIDGNIDAVADVSGTFDDMVVDADVTLSPLHVGDQTLDRSRLHVLRRPRGPVAPSPQPDVRGCYTGRKFPPFDPLKYFSDPLEGEYVVSGDVFGGAIKLSDFIVTDQKKKVASGNIVIRGLDLAPLSLLRPVAAESELDDKYEPAPPTFTLTGRASADVHLVKYPLDEWWNSEGTLTGLTLDVESGDKGIATAGTTPTITFGADGATLPKTTLTVNLGDANASVVLEGNIDRKDLDPLTGSPRLHASVTVPSIPLSKLETYFPRLERAEGSMRATLAIEGTIASPTWSGEVAVENGGLAIKNFAVPISAVNGKIKFDPTTGIRIDSLKAEVGGGTIEVSGGAAVKGFDLGDVDMRILAKDVHYRYGESMSMGVTADLHATWSPGEPGEPSDPARLEGVVDIDSFLYEKPVKLFDVSPIQTAQRTDVEAYDPLRDLVTFDIALRSKHGLRVRNNLVDTTMEIGNGGLRVVGSNQRPGLVGDVYVVAGGIFRLGRNDFEIREGSIKFADETKIDPIIDVVATDDFRRAAMVNVSTSEWRFKLHAYGTTSNLTLDITSDPPLSQEDAILLLTIGMTRAEANALGGATAGGIDFLAGLTGFDQTVKQAIPVDDFRVGTAYSVKTGRTEAQITLGKKLTDSLRASITSGLSEQRQVIGNIEWRLSRELSLQGSYDNLSDVANSTGNIGIDLRYRIEFD